MRVAALYNLTFRTDLKYTCTENYVNYYVFWLYHFPFSNVILYSMKSEALRKLFKFYIKHPLEFESYFPLRTAPVSEKDRYHQSWFVWQIFVPNQKTSINIKMAYKRKLSLRNLLDMCPQYGHLSNLPEIMEFSSFDVARQHRKPWDGPTF